jgi:signal transduction histidine kinase
VPVWAQTSNQLPLATTVLTNIYEIWQMPQAEKAQPHRIKTEVVIYYFDPQWNVAWGECLGNPAFLPIADSQTPLKAGQRVAIDGVVVPLRERFEWDKTKVHILEEGITFKAQTVHNLSDNPLALDKHIVLVEGLLDHTTWVDTTHVAFRFLAGDTAATLQIYTGENGQPLPFKGGDFVRAKCVYACQFDKDGKLSDIGLWVGRPSDVEIIGSLGQDPRFAVPITSSEKIRDDSTTNNMFHVKGIVQSHEPGKWVTIWDADGQILVQSPQTQPLRFGDRIEAVGYPLVVGVQQCLRGGLYRTSVLTNTIASTPASASNQPTLHLAERVRDLSPQEARRHLPVKLRAMVTWSHAETSFTYVQDASGGIRVVNPKWEGIDATRPGTIVTVEGNVGEGDFVPVVTNAVLGRVGYWNLVEAPMITLEQAMTGAEDGRWVQMRGFVRHVNPVNGLVRFDLSTSSGEFEAWVPASQPFTNLQGSIIRVQGVCAATVNTRHQLTGIQIWVPAAQYVQVEEPAPDNLFAAPMCSLGNLRRFNLESALNRRLRTSGTVVLHVPGRYLYVQDGADSVFALSEQKEELHPGDRVEVVGFPGNEGRRFVLREAVYRRLSTGAEPSPTQLPATHSVNADLEGLLAEGEGVLLNKVQKNSETILVIHTKDSTFEASLDSVATNTRKALEDLKPGSRLAVTGVYQVQGNEYGKPSSFLLRLRSPDDVHLLQRPPWWTTARLLGLLLGVLGVFWAAVIWSILISRKNRLLQQAQAGLQEAHDKLELRVKERTQELQQQVAAKERARVELAEAQERLMTASRQAGMAEVATSILHNVGNVLNSINVSTQFLGGQLHRCRVESVAKAATLLQEHRDQLAHFVAEDPKGKALPGYLEKLGESLIQDKSTMQEEIISLTKNIEHIKAIVIMQQGHAKVKGFWEKLDLKELMEDAIQINGVALERQNISVLRDYHPVPLVVTDRHLVLQILINLVSNARHALSNNGPDKKLIVTIAPAGPDRVRVSVKDNGVGIPPENVGQIFSMGFTTRKDGHGFGLHSGANAAKELGGSLTVQSEGVGHGATFILELPTERPPEEKSTPAIAPAESVVI